jgi:hypothetical protein
MRSLVLVGVLAMAACSSGSAAVPATSVGPDSVCSALVSTDVLAMAQHVAAGQAGTDPAKVAAKLAEIEIDAPTEMRAPFDNIIAGLRANSYAIIGPDSRLLAGECRARNLPIPVVS